MKKYCSSCKSELNYIGEEKIQLGEASFFVGAWSNLIAGALQVGIYVCPKCDKFEFYSYNKIEENKISQVICPICKHEHDMDYPKCPSCKYEY